VSAADVTPLTTNCASTERNQAAGLLGQNGGSFTKKGLSGWTGHFHYSGPPFSISNCHNKKCAIFSHVLGHQLLKQRQLRITDYISIETFPDLLHFTLHDYRLAP
jgi:hypothetical protein